MHLVLFLSVFFEFKLVRSLALTFLFSAFLFLFVFGGEVFFFNLSIISAPSEPLLNLVFFSLFAQLEDMAEDEVVDDDDDDRELVEQL